MQRVTYKAYGTTQAVLEKKMRRRREKGEERREKGEGRREKGILVLLWEDDTEQGGREKEVERGLGNS